MRDKKILCLLLCFLLCILSSAHAEESCVLVQYQTNHSALNQSTLDIASGMGYIIQDESGKLFVIDGGLEDDGYRFLQLIKEVSGEEKPHVDMWFLSHPHSDHYGALKAIAGTYPNQLTVDTILANFPPRDFVDTVKGTSYAPGEAALDTIRYTLNAELAVPHTGDTYQVGQISIEVATTWEDLKQVNECNETSTILMVRAGEKKILFLGDAYAATCKNAVKNYGDKLACDIVQVAHHAVCGGSVDLYKAANAKVYLIPNNRITVDICKKKDNVVYWVMKNAPEIVYAGDGTVYFDLSEKSEK